MYSDWYTRTVYKVKNDQTEEIIRLQGWVPVNLCVTSSGDLLVTMFSENTLTFQTLFRKMAGFLYTGRIQSIKAVVVRYSGSTVKQTIQFDEEGQPLYSCNGYNKYITVNRTLDICMADN